MSSPAPSSSRPASTGSLAGGLILGLMLAGMGAVFVFLLARGYQHALVTRAWTDTPCVVVESRLVEDVPVPHAAVSFIAVIRYRYTIGGREYTGSGIRRVPPKSAQKDRMEELLARFPAGSQTVCHVNPVNPAEAVLLHDTKAVGYTIWFPGLFVVGGLGIAFNAVKRRWRERR